MDIPLDEEKFIADINTKILSEDIPFPNISQSQNSPVDHPKHYMSHPSGIEVIEITRHMNFNLGNVIKYILRAGHKDKNKIIEDLKKAQWYLNDEIIKLEKINTTVKYK